MYRSITWFWYKYHFIKFEKIPERTLALAALTQSIMIWSHSRLGDTRLPRLMFGFINYAGQWFSVNHAARIRGFLWKKVTSQEGSAALLANYKPHSSIRWQPDSSLTLIFSSELKPDVSWHLSFHFKCTLMHRNELCTATPIPKGAAESHLRTARNDYTSQTNQTSWGQTCSWPLLSVSTSLN